MSAYVVDKATIDCLVSAWIACAYDTRMHHERINLAGDDGKGGMRWPTKVGAMLWQENHRSVAYRYEGRAAEAKAAIVPDVDYRYQPIGFERYREGMGGKLTATEIAGVAQILRCYEYQSCEHPEWEESKARQWCHDLRVELLAQLSSEDAPWGLGEGERDYFQNAAKRTAREEKRRAERRAYGY